MSKTVALDEDLCIGCEACVEECPEVFAIGPAGVAQVMNPDGGTEEKIESAIDLCPVNCIFWEE